MDGGAIEAMLEAGEDTALLRYTLGALLLKQGKPAPAVAHLQRAVQLDPNHSASWKLLAKALASSGDQDAAASAYREGIAVAQRLGDLQAVKEMQLFLRRLDKRS